MVSRPCRTQARKATSRSEEHTSELQSLAYLVCRLLLEKKKNTRACEETAHLKGRTSIQAKSSTFKLIRFPHEVFDSQACSPFSFPFFFNDTATTEIYTLSLHDALPISSRGSSLSTSISSAQSGYPRRSM